MMSPDLMPALAAGDTVGDLGDQSALGGRQADAVGDVTGHVLDVDAEEAAGHVAVLLRAG